MLFDKNVPLYKKLLIIFGLAVFAAAAVAFYLSFGKELLKFVSDTRRFRDWLNTYGELSRGIFVAVRAVQTVVKIVPAEPLEIGSGYAFGIWGGTLWCMAGTLIGSLFIIVLSKLFGLKFMQFFVPKDKLDSFNFIKRSSNAYMLLFFIYLIPGTPKDFITYFVWMLPVKTPMFLLVTSIARIPSIVTSTWCGAQLGEKNYVVAAIIFAATTIISVICLAIYRRFESKQVDKANK